MTRKELLRRAQAAGLEIRRMSAVCDYPCVITRKGRGAAAVILREVGVTRYDIDLTLAKAMTVTEAAKVLGL